MIVYKQGYRQVVKQLVERAQSLRVGNGADPKTDVGPVINKSAVQKILGYIDIGEHEDRATLSCGGNHLTKGKYAHGFFIEPTVFTDVAPNMRVAQEEIFGPVTSVIPANSLADAIDIADGCRY